MSGEYVFNVYKSYLVQVAVKESRPFSIPKNISSLEKRTDESFFYVLADKMKDERINTYKIGKFMEIAQENSVSFHVTNIIDNFEYLLKIFKSIKEDTVDDVKNRIKIAFDYIKEYGIINELTLDEMMTGNPPIILKLWKQKKIDERVVAFLFDINKMKKKIWFNIYCGGLISKISKIKKEISSDEISSSMEYELVKMEKSLNK